VKFRLIIFASALLSVQSPAFSQALCDLSDSEDSCKNKVSQQFKAPSLGAAPSDAQNAKDASDSLKEFGDQLAEKNTGAAPAVSPESASSFNDFFSTLKAAADSGSTDGDDDQAIGFELSRCARGEFVPPESSAEKPQDAIHARIQCQVRVRAGGAELYDPVKQALPADTRDARSKALEDSLDFGDNLTVGVFFNIVGTNWGRVPNFASEPLFADIWNVVNQKEDPLIRASNEVSNVYEDIREQISTELSEFDANTPFNKVAERNRPLAQKAVEAREKAWRAEFESADEVRKVLLETRYLDLVDLVNNQPQLNFGVEYTERGELAGPNEWRAKLIYEKGLVNVNTARRYVNSSKCKPAATFDKDISARRVACFNEYLSRPSTQQRLKGGDRLAVSIEAVRRKRYSINLPTDAITFAEDSDRSFVGALAYGFYVGFDDAGDARSRIDLRASYEDVKSDPKRQDRGLFVATYTQKFFEKTLVAVSVVYATQPEFRGDVDKDLSARLGINYKWGKLGKS